MTEPFYHIELVWGIVPLYFGWLLNELTSKKANFHTAIQTGFALIWAGAHWTYQYFGTRPASAPKVNLNALLAVNVGVTVLVLLLGFIALVSGLRRKFPRYCTFLGHSRFSAYFMIAIFPMQSNYLPWTWDRVAAIALFAAPIWLVVDFGLMPLRK